MGGWFWAIFFAISVYFGSIFTEERQQLVAQDADAQAAAISGSMTVYRNAVVQYALAHPTTVGAVSDTSLSLPTWYNKPNGISNYVTGGQGYVYYASPPAELAYQLLKATDNSMLAGIKRSGMLYNPIGGTSTIALPSAIPEAAVVYAGG